MRKAIVTITIGNKYKELASETHKHISDYASKIGAEFVIISEIKINKSTPHWEKFQLYDLLDIYDRIIYIDTDILVLESCPDLFDIVPEDYFGIMNERFYTREPGDYYNTGVMIISRIHKDIFKTVEEKTISPFYEQDYLNSLLKNVKIFHLDEIYNMMACVNNDENLKKAHMIHYANTKGWVCTHCGACCKYIKCKFLKDNICTNKDYINNKYIFGKNLNMGCLYLKQTNTIMLNVDCENIRKMAECR